MEFFKDPQIIKLIALGVAFIIGVSVCFYVAVRETVELNNRRRAKKLMYNDAVSRELKRKQMIKEQLLANEKMANEQVGHGQSNERSSFA